ncbi:hypothetical protein HMPREF1608_05301 [Escherichia coli 908525]|nr:hypothetical protein HMPREF1608_05301 [Escherichia coli 908525]
MREIFFQSKEGGDMQGFIKTPTNMAFDIHQMSRAIWVRTFEWIGINTIIKSIYIY